MSNTATALLSELSTLEPSRHFDGKTPPAAQLIELLLKGVANDACGASCNAQSLFRITSRAKQVAQEIVTLCDTVEAKSKDTQSALVVQSAFEQYTKLVDPLEE